MSNLLCNYDLVGQILSFLIIDEFWKTQGINKFFRSCLYRLQTWIIYFRSRKIESPETAILEQIVHRPRLGLLYIRYKIACRALVHFLNEGSLGSIFNIQLYVNELPASISLVNESGEFKPLFVINPHCENQTVSTGNTNVNVFTLENLIELLNPYLGCMEPKVELLLSGVSWPYLILRESGPNFRSVNGSAFYSIDCKSVWSILQFKVSETTRYPKHRYEPKRLLKLFLSFNPTLFDDFIDLWMVCWDGCDQNV